LNDFVGSRGEGALTRQVHAGELQAVEHGVGTFDVNLVDGEGVDDHGEGHLNGGAVFNVAEFHAEADAVVDTASSGDLVDLMSLVEALVEETEVLACEGG
jgi:hypothetical protein